MNENKPLLGCFVSGPTQVHGETEIILEQKEKKAQIFRNHIWGHNGIDKYFKRLGINKYGEDLNLILFQFYVEPLSIEKSSIKEKDSYRSKEKSLGVNLIFESDFFEFNENERRDIIFNSVISKLCSIKEPLLKRSLDTDIESIIQDLKNLYNPD